MINVTELRSGVIFEDDGNLYEVLTYEHVKQARSSGNIKVKVRNLKTGSTVEKSYITGARVQDVLTQQKKAAYLYADQDHIVFMDNETYEQFELPRTLIGEGSKFLKEGMVVTIKILNSEPVSVDMSKNVELKVTTAGAGIRGNSVSNVWKKAELENGMAVDVPLFIKDGDMIRVDTRTGQYIERVK